MFVLLISVLASDQYSDLNCFHNSNAERKQPVAIIGAVTTATTKEVSNPPCILLYQTRKINFQIESHIVLTLSESLNPNVKILDNRSSLET